MVSGSARQGRSKSSSPRVPSESDGTSIWSKLPVWIAQGLLLTLIVAAPWCLGGVESWFAAVASATVAICCVCWLLTFLTQRRGNELLPSAIIPLLVALAIPWFQVLELPSRVTAVLSPGVSALRQRLLPPQRLPLDLPLPDVVAALHSESATSSTSAPLSLYPAATRSRAALLALGVASFALGARFFRRQRALTVLFAVVTVNAVVIVFFGWVQKLSSDRMLIWNMPPGLTPFGPFIARTNGAGYLNVTLGCAVGLMLLLFIRRKYERVDLNQLLAIDEPAVSGWQALFATVRETIAMLNARKLAILLAVGCIAAGVFSSLSRGGMISLVAGAIMTVMVTRATGHSIRIGTAMVATVITVSLIFWVGLGGLVESRIGQIFEVDRKYVAGRGEILAMGAKLAARYWCTGSGLGTFRYVNKPEGHSRHDTFFEYAENQYLDTAIESGVVGLVLLLVVIVWQSHIFWRLLKLSAEALPWAVAGVFVLSSQAIHALSDFGLYLPSTHLLMGLVFGALAGRAAMIADENDSPRRGLLVLSAGRLWCPIVVASLLAVTIAGAFEAKAAAGIERVRAATSWKGDRSELDPEKIEANAEQLAKVLRHRWDDAAGQARLAELDILMFRFRALKELASSDVPESQHWTMTEPAVLHGRATQLARDDDTTALDQMRELPDVVAYLGPAWKHLALSRQACPMFDEVHLRLGELAFLVGNPLDDDVDLQRSLFLEPNNPSVLIDIGLLDLDAGRTKEGCAVLRRAWELYPNLAMGHVGSGLVGRVPFSLILDEIVPHHPEELVLFATHLGMAAYGDYTRRVLKLAEESIEVDHVPPAIAAMYRAKIAALRGSPSEAIDQYRQAIERDGAVAEWHFELALLLERVARYDEALNEARVAWRLAPDRKHYSDLVVRLAEHKQPQVN